MQRAPLPASPRSAVHGGHRGSPRAQWRPVSRLGCSTRPPAPTHADEMAHAVGRFVARAKPSS
eukprot:6763197-Prymnesium_polylepis.1